MKEPLTSLLLFSLAIFLIGSNIYRSNSVNNSTDAFLRCNVACNDIYECVQSGLDQNGNCYCFELLEVIEKEEL